MSWVITNSIIHDPSTINDQTRDSFASCRGGDALKEAIEINKSGSLRNEAGHEEKLTMNWCGDDIIPWDSNRAIVF